MAVQERDDLRRVAVMRVESDLSQEKLVRAKIPGTETGIEVKKTICSVCVAQCGINAYVLDGRLIKVEGAEENPTNRGRLCVKGTANRQYVWCFSAILLTCGGISFVYNHDTNGGRAAHSNRNFESPGI